ncbi:glycosyl-4,4'-diaponeurosporenoate acyltransferase [Staphylococcus equorum]|uniref:Glycosyl-4,4'-diaponeurosporenoate acyltransferase n=1 Tax=Staphylococcus equorum TaxID=246432 RepID=A0A9X4LAG7_9STAP|nr:glycosyl-4,4'-diaponeurosporenoate acyltransferase [Staphylococcus equorum]MDG0842935.1 glycosyl-4,4'-diaponeurosporenoate acyltransferase [Staphylococcus equorum]MDG0859443.1 glycosyl-4,4'-diaponeurosporenoate acyltransferase [Staphylococcus equorum]
MKKEAFICTLYWFLMHMSISMIGTILSNKFFEKNTRYFKTFNWEHEGRFWEKWFRVKSWKDHLPDGNKLNSKIKSKVRLEKIYSKTYIEEFIIETKKAELIHILSVTPCLIFLNQERKIKNINILYAILVNVPFVIVQRYNRPKLERYYQRKFLK